jgi:tRNA pseudouridine38-40 synthase
VRDALGEHYSSHDALAVAGRTDTGVHALANVVSVEVEGGPPVGRAATALNAVLPPDVAVVRAEAAPAGFHARFSAHSRTYLYRIWRRPVRSPFEVSRSLWHPASLELDHLNAAAAQLVGRHDFRAFTPSDTQHEVFLRDVEDARWYDHGDTVEFEITADSFLRHMVRTLVGTMLELAPEDLPPLLAGADRSAAGPTAPPGGLYLTSVRY